MARKLPPQAFRTDDWTQIGSDFSLVGNCEGRKAP